MFKPKFSEAELAHHRAINNPHNRPTGDFTGRCKHCGSTDLWDDNLAYGCNFCGALLATNDAEPIMWPDGQGQEPVLPEGALAIWTVYEKPSDFPEHFVARLFFQLGAYAYRTNYHFYAASIDPIRTYLMNRGLTPAPRMDADEPQIVETWI